MFSTRGPTRSVAVSASLYSTYLEFFGGAGAGAGLFGEQIIALSVSSSKLTAGCICLLCMSVSSSTNCCVHLSAVQGDSQPISEALPDIVRIREYTLCATHTSTE